MLARPWNAVGRAAAAGGALDSAVVAPDARAFSNSASTRAALSFLPCLLGSCTIMPLRTYRPYRITVSAPVYAQARKP